MKTPQTFIICEVMTTLRMWTAKCIQPTVLLMTILMILLTNHRAVANNQDSIYQIATEQSSENADSSLAPNDDGIECGCTRIGSYIAPADPVQPVTNGDGTSAHGKYKLTMTNQGNFVTFTIIRTSTNQEVLKLQNVTADQWGFSPDDDRFVYHSSQLNSYFVYNLALTSPLSVAFSGGQVLFSPQGTYLVHVALLNSSHTTLAVRNAETNALAYQTEFDFVAPSGSPGNKYGVARWGFSTDSVERTFVYGYVSGQTSVQRNVVNLATKQIIQSEAVLFISAFWEFSPCGDVMAIASQSSDTLQTVHLNHTDDGKILGGSEQVLSFGTTMFATTTEHHTVSINHGAPINLAANTAGQTCPSGVILTALRVSPTTVTGGFPVNAIVTLSGSTTQGGKLVQLTSSDPAIVAVPATVQIPEGADSATISLPTYSPQANTLVRITAHYGSHTESADLIVQKSLANAPALTALSFAVTEITGWNSTQGKVILSGAARPDGEHVDLISDHPSLLAVPNSVTVPAGMTEIAFEAAAQPVITDTVVSVAASLRGVTKTTTITVLRPTIALLTLPESIKGGNPDQGAIELNGEAPVGGMVVFVESSAPTLASVPVSVTFEEGQRYSNLEIETTGVATPTSVTLTARDGINVKSAMMTVLPADLETVEFKGRCTIAQETEGITLIGGQPTELWLSLDGAAPPGGAEVTLRSSKPSIMAVPGNVSIPAQQRAVTVTITPKDVRSPTSDLLSASYRGVEKQVPVTITHVATYTIVDLGDLTPIAINNSSQILAQRSLEDGTAHTFLWQRSVMTDIGVLTLPGFNMGQAIDINDKGTIVGVATHEQEARSLLWRAGVIVPISVGRSYTTSVPSAINNSDQVLLNIDYNRALLWQHGAVTELSPLPLYPESYGYDLNNLGEAVGYSSKLSLSPVQRYNRATLWQTDSIRDLGTIYGYWDSAEAFAINDAGEIVMVAPAYSSYAGFNDAYIQAGNLSTLLIRPSDYNHIWPVALNNHGYVIGSLSHSGDFPIPSTVFLYNGQATYRLLCTLPYDTDWELSSVSDINDADEIIGLGYRNDGSEHGFLLTDHIWTAVFTQTIHFDTLPDKMFGEAPFAITATATSGLPVTFTANGSCTVAENLVTLTATGICTITAHQVGDSRYNSAAEVTQSFVIWQQLYLPAVMR